MLINKLWSTKELIYKRQVVEIKFVFHSEVAEVANTAQSQILFIELKAQSNKVNTLEIQTL